MAYKAVAIKLAVRKIQKNQTLILIKQKFGGEPKLRMVVNKAGPVVTDNGMFLLDTVFPESSMARPSELDAKLQQIPGVVETGLFCNMADGCYFGQEDGTVKFVKYK